MMYPIMIELKELNKDGLYPMGFSTYNHLFALLKMPELKIKSSKVCLVLNNNYFSDLKFKQQLDFLPDDCLVV